MVLLTEGCAWHAIPDSTFLRLTDEIWYDHVWMCVDDLQAAMATVLLLVLVYKVLSFRM